MQTLKENNLSSWKSNVNIPSHPTATNINVNHFENAISTAAKPILDDDLIGIGWW